MEDETQVSIKQAFKQALPHSIHQIVLSTIVWLLSILVLWLFGRENPPVREEIWLGACVVIALALVFLFRFVWYLTAVSDFDAGRRATLMSSVGAIGMALFAVGFGSRSKSNVYSPPEELRGSLIVNRRLRLVDMVDIHNKIQGKRFEDCHIHGPIIIVGGSDWLINDCGSKDSPESMTLQIESQPIAGAIRIEDCEFARCEFHSVTFAAANANDLRKMLQAGGRGRI